LECQDHPKVIKKSACRNLFNFKGQAKFIVSGAHNLSTPNISVFPNISISPNISVFLVIPT
jgi:hypothetical protein